MKKIIQNIIIAFLVASGLFLFLFYSETGKLPKFPESLDMYMGFLLCISIISILFSFIGKWLNKKLSWQNSFGKRFFSGVFIYLFTAFSVSVLFIVIFLSLPSYELSNALLFEKYDDVLYKYFLVIGLLIILYTLIDLALYSYHQYAVGQVNSVKNQREILSHQYNALKKQLSPHFLFNSLNTVSSLLYRDIETAEHFIRKLATSYMKILDSTADNLITLSKELEIVESYKYLMEIRYKEALKIDINLSEEQKKIMLPPLSLQLLVENAIKHNLISNEQPLYVEIYCDDNEYLTVANNVNAKGFYIQTNEGLIENPEKKSTGIGLKNIKNRYSYYTSKSVKIEKLDYFKVKLPMLKKVKSKIIFN